jgi:hypothetical protein
MGHKTEVQKCADGLVKGIKSRHEGLAFHSNVKGDTPTHDYVKKSILKECLSLKKLLQLNLIG